MKNQLRLAMVLAIAVCTLPTFAQNTGSATYASKCQMCHGADGTASTPAGKAMKAPSFLAPEAKSKSTADLIAITRNGKGKMPAYAGKLSDSEIKDVVAHVRTLQKK